VFLASAALAVLPPVAEGALFGWLAFVILWSAFGVVAEADHLAESLGEPLGTLLLTLAVVLIEVALISAVMLGGKDEPTLGRDTMFAVLMIVLNGVVGLGFSSAAIAMASSATISRAPRPISRSSYPSR
jgi:Ca2+:H+ antiporter